MIINPLNAKLNPICHLLALLGAHPIFHVSRMKVKENFTFIIIWVNNTYFRLHFGNKCGHLNFSASFK